MTRVASLAAAIVSASLALACASACGGLDVAGTVHEATVVDAETETVDPTPLAGVRVCIDDDPDACVDSEDDGGFRLDGPGDGADHVVRFSADGFATRLVQIGGNARVQSIEPILHGPAVVAFRLPGADPLAAGVATVIITNLSTIEDPTPDGVSGGDVIGDATLLDALQSGTATSFLGLEAGDVSVNQRGCTVSRGGWRDDDGALRVRVEAGAETVVVLSCGDNVDGAKPCLPRDPSRDPDLPDPPNTCRGDEP